MVNDKPTYNVAQLVKEPVGATRTGQISVDLRDLVPELGDVSADQGKAEQPLAGAIRLMHTTDGVLVQGDLAGEVSLQCSRCLEPVSVPLKVRVEETFVPTVDVLSGQNMRPAEEDQALWIDEHHILDLSEVLRQDVLVALPMHPLCRADCRGLCSICGQNLNEGTCDCTQEPDPRWARLVDLLNDSQDESSQKE